MEVLDFSEFSDIKSMGPQVWTFIKVVKQNPRLTPFNKKQTSGHKSIKRHCQVITKIIIGLGIFFELFKEKLSGIFQRVQFYEFINRQNKLHLQCVKQFLTQQYF